MIANNDRYDRHSFFSCYIIRIFGTIFYLATPWDGSDGTGDVILNRWVFFVVDWEICRNIIKPSVSHSNWGHSRMPFIVSEKKSYYVIKLGSFHEIH